MHHLVFFKVYSFTHTNILKHIISYIPIILIGKCTLLAVHRSKFLFSLCRNLLLWWWTGKMQRKICIHTLIPIISCHYFLYFAKQAQVPAPILLPFSLLFLYHVHYRKVGPPYRQWSPVWLNGIEVLTIVQILSTSSHKAN